MQELYIETQDQLADLCAKLNQSPWLAVDTEFMREKTYYPKLCLIQIANEEIAACIDPLALKDLSPLSTLLLNPNIIKIFHAARQDLEIFYDIWKQVPQPLFDTQLAATLLGLGEQIGYGALVKGTLGIELSKSHSRTDWARRPLSKEQQRYALDDVIYLGQAYTKIKSQLDALQRTEWIAGDFTALADPGLYVIQPKDAWSKVKGRQRLKGAQLGILQTIAAWRETRAIESDKPRKWILKDEVLLDIARQRPKTLEKLEHIRGLEVSTIKHNGNRILDLIVEGESMPADQRPTQSKMGRRLTAQEDAQVDLLMCGLRIRASQHQLSPAAIANRKTLEKLITGEPDSALLSGWRHELIGADLQRILAGELYLQIQDGQLLLEPTSPQ